MTAGATYAKGTKALGVCKRCGLRSLLNELVFDSQIPWLRVCKECWDPKHPQERPVKAVDPQALWRPSPEPGGPTAPVLSLVLDGAAASLSWTASTVGDSIITMYVLYRSVDGGEYLVVDSFDIERDWDGSVLTQTLTYEDEGLSVDSTYSYYVQAMDAHRRTATSNTEGVTVSEYADAPTLFINAAGTTVSLWWLAPESPPEPIDSYRLYRSVDGGAYALLSTQPELEFTDTIERNIEYRYYVEAVDINGVGSLDSNIVSCETEFDGQWHVQPVGAIISVTNPIGLVFHPSGNYLYIADYRFSASFVYQFIIGADGKLTAQSPASVACGEATLTGIASTNGNHVYYPSNGSLVTGDIYQYSVGVDGKLTAKSPASVSCAANNPSSPVIWDDSFLYITCGGYNGSSFPGPDNDLVVFSIHPTTGALTRILNVNTINGCRGAVLFEDGPYLYITNAAIGTTQGVVAQFTLGVDGTPTPMATASFNTSQASGATNISIDSQNRLVYVSMANGTVDVYLITGTGELQFVQNTTTSISFVHPLEDFGYLASGSNILQYSIGVGGALTPLSPASVATSATINGGIGITPNGRYGYVAHRTSNTVQQFYLT